MSSETATAADTAEETGGNWKGGAIAGLAGGVLMGVMLTVRMTPVIEMAIPAMYGLSGLAAGWIVHLFHSAVVGLGFAAIAMAWPELTESTAKSAGTGLAYGVVVWLVLAVLVMPVWLSAVGFPGAPPFPNPNVGSLMAHVVYGVVLGAVYPSVAEL